MSEEIDCFEYLQEINPIDWINIPSPLRNGLFCIKDCIFKLKSQMHETSLCHDSTFNQINNKFSEVEDASQFIKSMIETVDQNNSKKINDVNDTLFSELQVFKKNTIQDFDFKQKSVDKKLGIVEESVFTLKRVIHSLATQNELEETVNKVVKEAKKEIMNQVKADLLNPEIKILATQINTLTETAKKHKFSIEETIEKLKSSAQQKEELVEAKLRFIEDSVASLDGQRTKDNSSYESFFQKIKQEISQVDSRSNKKLGMLNISIEKHQKVLHESDKKIIDIKDSLQKFHNEFEIFKLKQAERKQTETQEVVSSPDQVESFIETEKVTEIQPTQDLIEKFIRPASKIAQVPQQLDLSKNSRLNKIQNIPNIEIVTPNSPTPYQSKIPSPGFDTASADFSFQKVSSRSPELSQEAPKLDLSVIEEKISMVLSEYIKNIEQKLTKNRSDLEFGLKDVKEKLSWFPMNVYEIKGKNPYEARLFTIEARLRMEENSRVEQFNNLVTMISQLKADIVSPVSIPNFPNINTARSYGRQERRLSNEVFSDLTRHAPESEIRSNLSLLGSKTGRNRMKYTKTS